MNRRQGTCNSEFLKKYYQTISQEGIWPYVILLNLKIYRLRGKRPSKKKSYRL